MTRRRILQEDQSYTFRSYFEMPYEADEILAELGYSLLRRHINLPRSERHLERLEELKQRIEESLPLVSLSSETARRETLVAPTLLEVARYCQCQVRIEYSLSVNNWLKGYLDYFLKHNPSLLVVEAKNDDLTRGFTQLAVELIAISEVEEGDIFYGVVTIGDAWRFGRLEKTNQQIFQDISLYRIPDDLEDLMRILVGILE
ncbi:hypothetical protein H6G54_03455 [Anabaena cylindrica FACHB-243]|uniref:Type I restriction enzyme R protein N-terminal domain-containing protein n=1 Tax=Anabaena cylindrica (strain ATCC 27899 / PCC 7122) TaxID=272123 RepID=K9ZKR2_ANACC|nr:MULTISPECIES: hypothetical protein [Anabaena]AFZ59359.1 hypothetical protein Anacy_3988 [Anabaena cylindrica PCC 7122]MBD2416781.1 hypothetical protein [Anabaena cylindrica FACHB-243]MBY5280257.1 hypothetical protein [Anabaena sp. CCAP 1446/1C]MBY5308529.1 hypothetical protein [Anabaena sp. CCAP 1446/1C]MCM2405277.1 hypothetical protein [Anabaena sp. CCAP 1446/1C]